MISFAQNIKNAFLAIHSFIKPTARKQPIATIRITPVNGANFTRIGDAVCLSDQAESLSLSAHRESYRLRISELFPLSPSRPGNLCWILKRLFDAAQPGRIYAYYCHHDCRKQNPGDYDGNDQDSHGILLNLTIVQRTN